MDDLTDGRLEARDKRHILGPAIPRQVAPPQSLFPLHRANNNITNKNISVIRDRIGVTKQHYSLHEKTEMQRKRFRGATASTRRPSNNGSSLRIGRDD